MHECNKPYAGEKPKSRDHSTMQSLLFSSGADDLTSSKEHFFSFKSKETNQARPKSVELNFVLCHGQKLNNLSD